MLLDGKNAVIYGGGGGIGGATARAFAAEGAAVFLAGRTLESLDAVADEIRAAGGSAETARVDALDALAVEEHAATIGCIDVSFNAISLGEDHQGTPMAEMRLEDYLVPITLGATSHFLTATAAARRMVEQRSGVILTLSASAGRNAGPYTGGFGTANAAIEGLTRNLAGELGQHGVRVICLRADAIEDSWPSGGTGPSTALGAWADPARNAKQVLVDRTLLRRLPTRAEVAGAAVFAASDCGSALTSTVINLTCGSVPD